MTAGTLPSDDRSGASFQVHYLANNLVTRGHQVTVFSMSPRPEDALYDYRAVKRSPRVTIWMWALRLRALDFSGFDVLHCHGDDCFLAGRSRPRHVRTFHGSSLREAQHCEVLKFKVRIAALAVGEYLSLFTADLCIANSKSTLAYFPGVRNYVGCGVDLQAFKPGRRKSEKPSILFVGGIKGKKRGRLILEHFHKHVRPVIPDAELWVVSGETVSGDGVRFFGKVPLEELVALYQQAWIFCMPSSYEGFGVPYVEAMACGTPVVATANDGANEVLEAGRYGLIAEAETLGASLVHLLGDESLRTKMAADGIIRAQEYSWDRIVPQYLDLYAGNGSNL